MDTFLKILTYFIKLYTNNYIFKWYVFLNSNLENDNLNLLK